MAKKIVQGNDDNVIAFVNNAIDSGNPELMKGIAESVVDLSNEQKAKLLLSGSLDVVNAMIASFKDADADFFRDVDKIVLTADMIKNGARVIVADENGNLIDPFLIRNVVCNEIKDSEQDASLRFSKQNIAEIVKLLNLDKIDFSAVSTDDIIVQIEKDLLSNQDTPSDVVTPYLESENQELRAKAFVHKNTDNAAIIEEMKKSDENSENIDAFKLAMIKELNTDDMIQSNPEIVKYLLQDNQSNPVRFAIFKNYVSVVLNGGKTVDGIDIDSLIETFVK
jgi:hypothetical protein